MGIVAQREEFLNAVSRTLEDAAFVFVEEVERNSAPWADGSIIEALITFRGPESGHLTIAVTQEHAIALAANLLVVDPEAPDAVKAANDALGELANILCGVLLESWFPGDGSYGMGTPLVRRLEPGDYEARTADASLFQTLMTDEGNRIDAAVFAEATGCASA